MNSDIILGKKFYDADNINDIYRLVRVKNKDTYILKNCNDSSTKKVNKEELDKYVAIKQHGVFYIIAVYLEKDIKDVLCLIGRKPGEFYTICRQMIPNVFDCCPISSTTVNLGCSVNVDTCPLWVNFNDLCIFDRVISSSAISIYIGDTVNSILDITQGVLKYDSILYDNLKHNPIYPLTGNGYYPTVKKLLTANNFNNDIRMAFNIFRLESEISDHYLNQQQQETIIYHLKRKVEFHLVIPYGHDINMDAIKDDYILVSDINDKVFIVTYS